MIKKILITVLNLISPFFIYFILLLIDFFLNGSSIQSSIINDSRKYLWIILYLIFAFIQSALIYKIADIKLVHKYFLIMAISIIYLNFICNYF